MAQCETCGADYNPRSKRSRYCSRPCLWKGNKNRKAWNAGTAEGWTDKRGYHWRYITRYGKRVAQLEHRLIMEWHLNRPLEPTELVHHKNGILNDNRPGNLEIMTWPAHTKHHATGRGMSEQARRTLQVVANYRHELKRLKENNLALLEALEARYASLSEPNGLHKYIKGTHASLCVACTWREWTQSLIRLAKGEKGANSG